MMRGAIAARILMLGTLIACANASGGNARKDDLRALETAAARDSLASAAVRIAVSGDPAALERLGKHLAAPAFLARLDDTASPQLAYSNLNQVFAALAKHPSRATETLCLRVLEAPAFDARSDRRGLALTALAAVRPMSEAGAVIFGRTNGEGYYNRNGILLAANGSGCALVLLRAMFADKAHTVPDRIAMAREGLVPYRTEMPTVRLIDSLTLRPDLEPDLAIALAECLFAYRPEEWYGKRRNPPAAPDWKRAPSATRREAARLGERLLAAHPDWPEGLREAIRAVILRG